MKLAKRSFLSQDLNVPRRSGGSHINLQSASGRVKEISLKFIVSLTGGFFLQFIASEKSETRANFKLRIMSMMQKIAVVLIDGANILFSLEIAYNPISPA